VPNPFKRSRRHWLVVGTALAVTLGAATASALGLSANPSLRHPFGASAANGSHPAHTQPGPVTTTMSIVPLAAGAHTMSFGLNYATTLMSETPAQMRASLQDAVALGAKWIRVDLPWEQVQPNNASTYLWSRFDAVADTASSLGLKIDAILDSTAYWDVTAACKKSAADTEFCPPQDDSAFGRFAAAAVKRYKNRGVGAWEIWNEPNISARWWPVPNPADYARMLSTVARSIRGADPGAFIVMGGLAAVPENTARDLSKLSFLSSVVKISGSMADVNAISYHPFSAPTPPSRAGDFQDVSSSPGNLLSILQANGDGKVQIWITESGTTEYDGALLPAGTTATAAQLQAQADYATDLVKTVSTNPNVAADFWFADQDIPAQDLYWGLRDAKGAARPVFDALKQAIAVCGCSAH
jgi:hypothetical protein